MKDDLTHKRTRAAVFEPPKKWRHDQFFHTPTTHHNVRYSHAQALGKPRGTIVLTHGYSENIDCYHEDIKRFQKRGFEVYALEWHGYGRSGRFDALRPDVPPPDALEDHVQDLHDFIENVVLRGDGKKDKPLVMSTNSMGAQIGAFYLHDHPGVFDGAIMSSPLFEFKCPVSNAFRPLVKAAFGIASRTRLRDAKISRNWEDCDVPRKSKIRNAVKATPAEINHRREFYNAARRENQDAIMGAPTVGWVAAACKSIGVLLNKDFLEKITTPILIGSGSEDPFVDNRANAWVAKTLPHGTHVEIKGAGHTLWRECDSRYEQWWSQVEKFTGAIQAGAEATTKPREITSWREFLGLGRGPSGLRVGIPQ